MQTQIGAKKLSEYPNVRKDLVAVLDELEEELGEEQKQDVIFVNFAFLAKCKGFRLTERGKRVGEKVVTPEFFLDTVTACFGGD